MLCRVLKNELKKHMNEFGSTRSRRQINVAKSDVRNKITKHRLLPCQKSYIPAAKCTSIFSSSRQYIFLKLILYNFQALEKWLKKGAWTIKHWGVGIQTLGVRPLKMFIFVFVFPIVVLPLPLRKITRLHQLAQFYQQTAKQM